MMGRYKIDLYAKGLAYKELQPIAKALGMQLLILDPKTYRTMLDFDKRLKRFGISPSEVSKLQREMDDGSTVAIFKSKKHYGIPEILPYFSNYDLDEDAIHFMRSTNADKHEVFGDFSNDIPESKRMFLYWINVDVLDENGTAVLESAENEWKVKFTDDEEDGEQIASFGSEREASNWIKCQEINDRYEPHHFEVVDGPYREQATTLHETCQKMKSLLEKLLVARSQQQLEEAVASSKADPKVIQYAKDFKDFFGYKDDYMPKKSYSKEMDSLAAECALRMPTDTEAREIEGDAVMLLVLSGEEEAVKAGKKLGDCMMKKGKHDEETLLKRMSDAYKALQGLWAKHERDVEESEDTTMKKRYTKKQITEAIAYWKKQLKKLDESGSSSVDYKKLWSDFKTFYKKGEDNCDVSFRVNGEVKGIVSFVNTSDTLGVKLKNLSHYSREEGMVLDVKSFIKEMLSYGLTSSKIKKFEASFEGKGYDLVGYTEDTPRMRRVFFFEFSDGNDEPLDNFFNEAENPDDAKADDLFIKSDEYEEELKAKAELAKEESKKIKQPEDAKKFLDKNKAKIAEVSKKLSGKAKENFDKVVKFIEDNSSSQKVDEASKSSTVLLGLLFGCVGVIAFLLNLNTVGWIALSPVVGPLLMATAKKISGLNERVEIVGGNEATCSRKFVLPSGHDGDGEIIVASDLVDAIDNAFPHQKNIVFCFGEEGKIDGWVNQVLEEKRDGGACCILTLAPYKNGRRQSDCWISGPKVPMHFEEMYSTLKSNGSNAVYVRYKDPLDFVNKSIVDVPLREIVIDKTYGIFLRPNADKKQKVQAT